VTKSTTIRYRDIVTIAASAYDASGMLSQSASTKHMAGWDGHTGRTGTVAQSDKSTRHIHLMML